jgi:hypothetical protein
MKCPRLSSSARSRQEMPRLLSADGKRDSSRHAR